MKLIQTSNLSEKFYHSSFPCYFFTPPASLPGFQLVAISRSSTVLLFHSNFWIGLQRYELIIFV